MSLFTFNKKIKKIKKSHDGQENTHKLVGIFLMKINIFIKGVCLKQLQ